MVKRSLLFAAQIALIAYTSGASSAEARPAEDDPPAPPLAPSADPPALPPPPPPPEPETPTPAPPVPPAPPERPADPSLGATASSATAASDLPDEDRQAIVRRHRGFQWGVAPGLFVQNSKVRLSLNAYAGYGFDTGALLVTPGLAVGLLFPEGGTLWTVAPRLRVGVPVGFFYPFVEPEAGIVAGGDPGGISPLIGAAAGFYLYPIHNLGLGVAGGARRSFGEHALTVLTLYPLLDLAF